MARSSRKGSRSAGARSSRPNPNGALSSPPAPPDDRTEPTVAAVPAPRRRMSTLRRILIGVAAMALVAILALAVYLYIVVQKTLPTTSGTINLPGLSAPVTVTRDVYGVPHITAANVKDLYTAQGYVHAQDHLFQMFYYRQLGEGRLGEAFGPSAAQADIFLRTVGMRRAAETETKALSPKARSYLEAYAKGVNAFIHTHQDSLPLEFTLAGLKMEDWQPVDSIAFAKVMAWNLSRNWDTELINADVRAKLGPDRTAQLFPDYPAEGPFIVPGQSLGSDTPPVAGRPPDENPHSITHAIEAFNRDVRPWLPETGMSGLGSNNWVVDGTKSATGKPLLSNDPHLGVQNPSIWYQIHLSTSDGKYDVAGFGFTAFPGIVTGHNQNIAWGVTNTEGDVEDLFIEKLDPTGHPGQYLTPDGWQPMQLITETIQVRGDAPITHTVRITRHGPILSDALTAISSTIGTTIKEPLALQWTAAQPGHIYEAALALQMASNWQEFRAALAKWSVPGQNFVYADRQGNIGYQMTGDQPVRKKGDGKAPVPGWTGEYDWTGNVPYDDLPRLYNPPDHFIATANNKNYGPGYKYPIEAEWAPPWRISRITEMLKAKDKLSVDDYKQMLMDTHSPMAKKMAPMLANLKPTDAKGQDAVKMLQGWDGNLSADSVPASIYKVTVQRAISETFYDDLGQDLFQEYAGSNSVAVNRSFELLLDRPDDPFWDRTGTPQKEKRDDILLTSLNSAMTDLTSALGDDMTGWTWGKSHTVTPSHPFGSQPGVGGIFNLPTKPFGGDVTTVSIGEYNLLDPFGMITYQSYRMILDTSDWTKSLSIFVGGESGQPFAKHWGDQFSAWQQGDFDPMLYTPQQVDANKDGVLMLVP